MFTFVLFFLFPLFFPPLSLSLNQDGLFLLEARQQLSDPDNALSSWNHRDATPCRWRGVTCDSRSGSVIAVKLSSLNLGGSFPSAVCGITSLSSLNLSNNFITSNISGNAIAGCRWLNELDLSDNGLIGPIPDALSRISNLRYLNLSMNNFSGDIPASLSILPHLEILILVSNLLNGTIPSSLGNLTSLKSLQLAYNPFTPSIIPSSLGNLTNLETLWLAQCNLVGSIPDSFGNLASLTNLDVSVNRLTGAIPTSITRLKRVSQIELYNNSLSGVIPIGMSNMTSLQLFDASMNDLTGTIPSDLCELPLASLNLYENNLEGTLPASIARSPNLYELKLFTNNLVGTLPSDLGNNSALNLIDVSNNHFSGEIPASLCRWGQFEEFILMYNSFSGEIPESLGNCESLRRVRLGNNNLSGTVPEAFWGLPHLHLLELADNSFSGSISNAISGASSLVELRLNNNLFSGPIPEGIGSLNVLAELQIYNNKFSGRIPDSLAKLGQLGCLDLSYNEFSGEVSSGIGRLTKLTAIRLKHNRLVGKIPSEIGSLPLLTMLDLSFNNFSGEIPIELQNLKLYDLNLSYNQLHGGIPPLYDNERYSASFIGNPGLCGGLPSGLCNGSGNRKTSGYVLTLKFIFVLAGAVFIAGVVWFYLKYRELTQGFSTSKWRFFHKLDFSEFEVVKLLREDNVIGSGASGKVYKVVLSNGEMVAVKKLWGATAAANVNQNVGSRKDEFEAEVETLGKIRHKNIVRLWCCCNIGDHRLLFYEYMANGSLADVLKGSKKTLLDWPTRLKIAIDTAEGLAYLHHDCVPPIVHRDVKSKNILLDGDFVAKVADFGLAKMVTGVGHGAESVSVIAGTCGYIAPEYAYTLRVNEKSDTYSFGVVILELITGKLPIDPEYGENDLVKWVSSTLEHEGLDHMIDSTLDSKYMEQICKVLNVALQCTSSIPTNRPTMRSVVKMLQNVTTVSKRKIIKDVKSPNTMKTQPREG